MQVVTILILRRWMMMFTVRMTSRARPEEATLPIEHFERLHKLHEEWLLGTAKAERPPVIVIDADEDISSLAKKYRQLAKAVWRATNKM